MAIVKKIEVIITAGTRALEAGLARGGGMIARFTRSLGTGLQSLIGFRGGLIGVTTALVAFGAAVHHAEAFNRAMARSTSIMGDLDAKTQAAMRATAREAAFGTEFSETEAAKAYYYLASAGMDAKQSMAALGQMTAFAQAGMFDLSRATDLATDAQSALGLSSKNAQENLKGLSRVTDVLIKANTLANATTEQFSEALTTKTGPALRILGKDIEEGVAALAVLANQGIKGSEAGTQLAIVLRDLQRKSIDNAAAFRKHGVAVYDAQEKMRQLPDILADLEKALDGASDKMKKQTLIEMGFAEKSVMALQAVIGFSDEMRQFTASLYDANGITQRIAQKTMPPFTKGLNDIYDGLRAFASVTLAKDLDAVGYFLSDLGQGIHDILVDLGAIEKRVIRTGHGRLIGTRGEAEAVAQRIRLKTATRETLTGTGAFAAGIRPELTAIAAGFTAINTEAALAKKSLDSLFEEDAAKLQDTVDKIESKWKEAVETFGMTEAQRDLWQLKELGVAEETIKHIAGLMATFKGFEAFQANAEAAARFTEKMHDEAEQLRLQANPFEKAVKDIERVYKLSEMFPEIVDEETIAKEIKRIEEAFKSTLPETIKLQQPAALERGSQEEFAARVGNQQLAVERDQLLELRRQTDELRQLRRNTPQAANL